MMKTIPIALKRHMQGLTFYKMFIMSTVAYIKVHELSVTHSHLAD